ncbi:hypothetical protein [Pseudomonas sp. PS01298]|uniref:hypothetical protein n=1 Tax=Pseudomonas sp. PS01298 TaxID=2991434 RepID=UPI0013C437F1|nr:hypothetical protein [Pseudomonas sp. PS01298]QTV15508.1 hypothetical protein J9321_20440 [Pseudomonas fluorescens]
MDNIWVESRVAARSGFDPAVQQQPSAARVARSATQQTGSGPVFGVQDARPPVINFSPSDYGSSQQPYSYGAYLSNGLSSSIADAPAAILPGKARGGIWNKAKDIFGGFFQSQNGNCATISGIKALSARYGSKPTDLFSKVEDLGDRYRVTKRDGKVVEFTHEEYMQVRKDAGIDGSDPIARDNAAFAYAVAAKQAEYDNHEGSKGNFTKALASLKNGEYTKDLFDRLGFKGLYRKGTVEELRNGSVGIIEKDVGGAGTGHSMAVIAGVEERWGKRGNLVTHGKITDTNGNQWSDNVLVLT